MRILACVALLFVFVASAQTLKPRPSFADYPANNIYRGTPVPPKLSRDQRTFRTMIRFGAKEKVEFAGHYTLPRWGCGAGCSMFVIVDSVTGRVYDAPFSVAELPGAWIEEHENEAPERMEFRPNSRLLKFNGCLNERDCGFYDYLMVEGKGLKLLRKELLPQEYQ